ncbi:acetylxylan esterase [Paenibacillus sp. GCM10027626]|uniref:acetylxylan esterase n=1 Tax=Paenibacillus sp. GCM10027626 TaxID=3273411 RepID=UPI003637B172
MTEQANHAVSRRIAELEQFMPPLTAKDDFSAFWKTALQQAASRPLQAMRKPQPSPMPYVDVFKVEYNGYDDTPIAGWFIVPRFAKQEKLPCLVHFHGYTGSKGYPEQYAQFALMGMAVFAVDIRGQGGETGNLLPQQFGMTAGWMTQGILDKDNCYYKAITIDAMKALDWAAAQAEVDPERIVAYGGSQGGGLVLVTAALSDKPAIAIADIPNMCHMDYGILNSTGSVTEAARFLERFPDQLEAVLDTLSYFDVMNLADRIQIPLLVSCCLKDTISMPEMIFAAYNRITSPKEIQVYPFTGHAVVGYQNRRALEFITRHFFPERQQENG